MSMDADWRKAVGTRSDAGAIIRRVQDTFITQAEATQKYGVSHVTLWRWRHNGIIQAYSIGREQLYVKKTMEAMLNVR